MTITRRAGGQWRSLDVPLVRRHSDGSAISLRGPSPQPELDEWRQFDAPRAWHDRIAALAPFVVYGELHNRGVAEALDDMQRSLLHGDLASARDLLAGAERCAGVGGGAEPTTDAVQRDLAAARGAAGTAPVPPGTIRLYHYTRSEAALDSILRTGVLRPYALGQTYGEPNMVWASAQKPADHAWYVEFWADPTTDLDIGRVAPGRDVMAGIKWLEGRGANVTMVGDVPPDRILTYNRPWFGTYRYLLDNPDGYGSVEQLEALLGGFPDGADDSVIRPAILHRLGELRDTAAADSGATSCLHCGRAIAADAAGTFVDETGGDVCGWAGSNEPHEATAPPANPVARTLVARLDAVRESEPPEFAL